jgi:hypothetical protein
LKVYSEPIQPVEDSNGLGIEFSITSECNQESWSLRFAKIDAAPKDHCMIALTWGGNLRNARGDEVIARLSMAQTTIFFVSWSLESAREQPSIVQFESCAVAKVDLLEAVQFESVQLLKVEPAMVDPWISTRFSVQAMNAVLRIVISWIVEFLIVGSVAISVALFLDVLPA